MQHTKENQCWKNPLGSKLLSQWLQVQTVVCDLNRVTQFLSVDEAANVYTEYN